MFMQFCENDIDNLIGKFVLEISIGETVHRVPSLNKEGWAFTKEKRLALIHPGYSLQGFYYTHRETLTKQELVNVLNGYNKEGTELGNRRYRLLNSSEIDLLAQRLKEEL